MQKNGNWHWEKYRKSKVWDIVYVGKGVGIATLSGVLSKDGENLELKGMLIKEFNDCSECEMKVILSVVKSLRSSLISERT